MIRERRIAGSFGCLLLPVLSCVIFVPPGAAEVVPPRGAVDSRVRSAPYEGDQVYRLRGFTGYQIDLEFESGESFVGLGAGDIEGLAYYGEGNHLFLKPKAPKVATNLTVLTSRRHYQIAYAAAPGHPGPADTDVIFVLRFVYPPPPAQAADAARAIDARLDAAADEKRLNTDYWYCGGAVLRPVYAVDDGVHTRLRFAANADLPALFVRGDDGSETLLNYSMDDGDMVVHRIARQFILRRGTLTGCVVNKGFTGGGMHLKSGTVTPVVERRVQGAVHE